MQAPTERSVAYHFADFTHANYERLLALAARQYVFRQYDDYDLQERFVLWRHDLDFSVQDALPLARMEAAAGLRCSYFVNIHSEFYNAFEAGNMRAIAEIAGLGHAIGLHFDFALAGVASERELGERLAEEAGALRSQYRVPIRAFSFHNPTPAALAFDEPAYAGLANTYAARFRTEVGYCSDSNGHWRFDRLEDVLARPATRPLQVLTHPTWWTAQVMSPKQKIERTVAGLGAGILDAYVATLAGNGREDIDW